MSSYDIFALYYDSLTKNVKYTDRADYLLKVLKSLNHDVGIALDLACGTGSLTIELYKNNIDVYGVDASNSMLSVAKDKAYDLDVDIMFLCQKMENLDLFGTVNTVFCCLDSINHLRSFEIMQEVFDRVSLFLEPNCYFVFDFNTPYKHEFVLAENAFVYDTKDVYCVWQNNYRAENHRVDVTLDFFEKENTKYNRYTEKFFEITCDTNSLVEMLKKSGFKDIKIFDDMTENPPKEDTQRIVVFAKKGNFMKGMD